MANELTGRRAVRWCTTHASDFLKIVSLPAAKLHQHLFDIKLAGDSTGRPQPQMCDDQAGCRHLTEDFAEHWAPHMPPAVQNGYRCECLQAIDGANANLTPSLQTSTTWVRSMTKKAAFQAALTRVVAPDARREWRARTLPTAAGEPFGCLQDLAVSRMELRALHALVSVSAELLAGLKKLILYAQLRSGPSRPVGFGRRDSFAISRRLNADLVCSLQIMSFFVGLPADVKAEIKGDLVARGTHHELAARIARNGREFAQQQWRDIDWQVYLARVLIEWHRVVHRDEED